MAAVDDVDKLIEQFHLARAEIVKGNPEPMKKLWSRWDHVTLANPYSPPARGWEQVAEVMEHGVSQYRDGYATGVEIVSKHVTPELAYVVEIERFEAKVGGRKDTSPIALRATMIFRPEDGEWKIVHRHADPITTPQPAESVIQEQIHP
jgi:ketosteroid isomerase-like protein